MNKGEKALLEYVFLINKNVMRGTGEIFLTPANIYDIQKWEDVVKEEVAKVILYGLHNRKLDLIFLHPFCIKMLIEKKGYKLEDFVNGVEQNDNLCSVCQYRKRRGGCREKGEILDRIINIRINAYIFPTLARFIDEESRREIIDKMTQWI